MAGKIFCMLWMLLRDRRIPVPTIEENYHGYEYRIGMATHNRNSDLYQRLRNDGSAHCAKTRKYISKAVESGAVVQALPLTYFCLKTG